MAATVGFACAWDRTPETTWSGTPWRLREALRSHTRVLDLDLVEPDPLRAVLRVAGVRRTDGGWRSMWRHGRAHVTYVEQRLRRQAESLSPDVVLEIQDLGVTRRPFLVTQDLSYGLLLKHADGQDVPHFRTLGAGRIRALHERQLAVYREASMLLPMSRWLADDMVAGGVPPERVTVVNPGINVTPRDTPLPDRRQGPLSRLLFVGRDFDTKAGPQVVAAFRLLRAELGPAVELTVIGPRTWPLHGEIPDGVHFEGPQPRERVADALDTHDLFVMPSLMEGFGIAFAEALVRGLPCIGRRACAMPEIIDPVSGGRLVDSEDPRPLADLVLDALADDALYEACRDAAASRRAHYSWDRAARQVVAAADAVLA